MFSRFAWGSALLSLGWSLTRSSPDKWFWSHLQRYSWSIQFLLKLIIQHLLCNSGGEWVRVCWVLFKQSLSRRRWAILGVPLGFEARLILVFHILCIEVCQSVCLSVCLIYVSTCTSRLVRKKMIWSHIKNFKINIFNVSKFSMTKATLSL